MPLHLTGRFGCSYLPVIFLKETLMEKILETICKELQYQNKLLKERNVLLKKHMQLVQDDTNKTVELLSSNFEKAINSSFDKALKEI